MPTRWSCVIILVTLTFSAAFAQVGVKLEGPRLSWQCASQTLGSGDQWLQVRDLAAGESFTPITVQSAGGKLTASGLGLKFSGQWQPRGIARELTLTVTANPPVDRAVIVRVALPLQAQGWTWWDDMGTPRAIEAGKHYDRLTNWGGLRTVSTYPFCAVTREGTGLSLAVPVHEPQVFRLAYDATRSALEAEFDLGLSPDAKKLPCQSTIRLLVYPHDPAWSFRSAMERYYQLFPEYAQRRVGPGGIWLINLDPRTMASPWDWGFRFEEHGLDHAGYNDLHDTLTFVYTECWGIYEGFGNNPPADGKDRYGRNVYMMKPEEMRQFILDKLKAPPDQKFWGLPRSEVAQAEVNSAIHDPKGEWIWSHYTQTWSPGNFLANLCLNPDPDLPRPSRNSVTWDGEITPAYQRAKNGGGALGGVYLDSVCGYVGFYDENFRREHWQYADTPLVASYKAKAPTQLHCFSCFEISKQIADRMRAEGKYMIGNTGPPEMMYWIPLLDMIGAGEAHQCGVSNEPHYRYLRFCAYHKPISWMQYGFVDPKRSWEEKERGMHRCVFYGVHPGTASFNKPDEYEPSRPLYRAYEPLVMWVDEAGWQPVTAAATGDPALYLERYGPGQSGPLADVTLLALRNAGKEAKAAQVTVQPGALPKSAGTGAIAWALIGDREVTLTPGKSACTISGFSLAPDTTELIAVGRRDAIARLFLKQSREWLDRLAREGRMLASKSGLLILANGDFEGGLSSWGLASGTNARESTGALEEAQPLSGKRSIRCQSQSENSLHGLNQSVTLSPGQDYILRFKYSWTRPEGAKGVVYPRFGVKGPDGQWAPDKYLYFRDLQPTGGQIATYERHFTVPAGCTTGFFQFMFERNWGTAVLDEVEITSTETEAMQERLKSVPVQAAAAGATFETALRKAAPTDLLGLIAKQEGAYRDLSERITALPEGHLQRCLLLPTRNFAESLGRAAEVLSGVSLGCPAGPLFAGAALGAETELALAIHPGKLALTGVQVTTDTAGAVTAGLPILPGQDRLLPLKVTTPAEARWGWHDVMINARFRLGKQEVWLPRRVTLRARPPVEVSAAGTLGTLTPVVPLSLRCWQTSPGPMAFEGSARLGTGEFPLPSQQLTFQANQPLALNVPVPASFAGRLDSLAAAGERCQVRWNAAPAGGQPFAGETSVELLRGMKCPLLKQAPVADGQFSAAEWTGAAKVAGFVRHDDAVAAARKTEVYAGHDGSRVYFAFICHDQMAPQAPQRPRDGAVWEDDAVELFLQPPGSDSYYHFAVSASASRFEARCPGSDASWNPEWSAQAGRVADGWLVEMAVPLTALGAKAEGIWRVNFGREESDARGATCWSPTFGGFHVPARFGQMAF